MTGEMKTDETKTCGSVRAGCGQHHADSAGSSKKTDDKKDGRLTLEPAQGFTSSTLLVRGVTAEALEAARAKWWAGGRVSSEPVQGFLCKTCKGTGLTELEPEKGDAGTGSGKAHEGKGSGGGSRSRSRARTALRGATYREQV